MRRTLNADPFKLLAVVADPARLLTQTIRRTPTRICRRSRRSSRCRRQEEAKRLWLPPGYRMEPVLSDPLIEDPAQIAFDGNGRMFVVELRGYFQTPEGIDLDPARSGGSRMHEDRDNDGVFERHSVFVDKLVFPRFVMPFGANTILTMETNADEVWKYTDTNGDGVADKKELFTTSFGRAGNMESQQASLFWAMDNWLYSTVNAFRLRWTPNGAPEGTHRAEQLAVGRDAGQRRQGLVPGRRQRTAGLLPVPGPLRQLRAAGSVRARPEHRVGRADPASATSRRDCRARACRTAR